MVLQPSPSHGINLSHSLSFTVNKACVIEYCNLNICLKVVTLVFKTL